MKGLLCINPETTEERELVYKVISRSKSSILILQLGPVSLHNRVESQCSVQSNMMWKISCSALLTFAQCSGSEMNFDWFITVEVVQIHKEQEKPNSKSVYVRFQFNSTFSPDLVQFCSRFNTVLVQFMPRFCPVLTHI